MPTSELPASAAPGRIALVCMPWHALAAPSIQLGTLQAILQRAGFDCQSHSLFLELFRYLATPHGRGSPLLTLDDYRAIGDHWFLSAPGEWVFAGPPLRPIDAAEDQRYLAALRRQDMPARLRKRLVAIRQRMPEFVDACAREVLATAPAVVGFTTTFGQTVASLALARRLKELAPHLRIAFGGANCEGPMGEALLRSYPIVDVVVRGEAEPVVAELMRALLVGAPLPRLPGLCFRDAGQVVCVPERTAPGAVMDEVPVPDYREYFARLECVPQRHEIAPVLPFESSRGCWWGAKSHCTFCGLNGSLMRHRSKSPTRVVDELMQLADAHGVLDFTVVDNILDYGYFATVLPELRARGLDLSLFYQTKANLSREQVQALRDAGVRRIRPGIESLSTPILQRMAKGVTALQNVRLLKWCAQAGVHVAWNLIYGLPGEPPEEYRRMAAMVRDLVHLAPPSLGRLTLDRFSPYHADPRAHGLRVLGAPPHYRALYGLDDRTLRELAWTFDYELEDGADPESYVGELRQQVAQWRRDYPRNGGGLTYRRGPSFLVIEDRRTTHGYRRFTLDEVEARVYLGCDTGAAPGALAAALRGALGSGVTEQRVRTILDELAEEHLVYAEAGRYLALAVPADSARAGAGASAVPPLAPHTAVSA